MRNFQILMSKSVNSVYKLLQLLGDFVSRPTTIGASPLDPIEGLPSPRPSGLYPPNDNSC